AREIFNLSKDDIKCMNKKTLTKLFRQLARQHHPDKGGDHDNFVELNNAFERLREKLK
ncbi:MAG: J domain-containing protein, partial [Desulfobacteraceae bacterium]|nr:J domain-containing protein [Desulfobacteraceae bacterium]